MMHKITFYGEITNFFVIKNSFPCKITIICPMFTQKKEFNTLHLICNMLYSLNKYINKYISSHSTGCQPGSYSHEK